VGKTPDKASIIAPRKRSLGEWLRTHLSDTQRYLVIWAVTGVACGLTAVAFHLAIDFVFHTLFGFAGQMAGASKLAMLPWLIGLPAAGGLITGFFLWKFAPHAAGSGIPQTKARYHRDFGVFKLREATWRFFLGSVSVGFGMSLGREGPTVHICAALASKIGQWFGVAKKRVQAMVPLGMGAGIAAAFNTPMAAVFFVFEELLGDFSSKSFFGLFMVVVIAATVQRVVLGEHPAFDIELGLIETDWWMLMSIPLGLIAAFLGKGFVVGLLRVRLFFRDQPWIPLWGRPAAGGLLVGLIGATVWLVSSGSLGIFGIGYADVDSVLNGRSTVAGILFLLLIGKVAACIIAYGSGGSGGLFAPTLFIGAMLGGLLGVLGQPFFGYNDEIIGAMALLGMGACFASIIRAPMTSIVIIWEMTMQYGLILPLMAGNMIAWLLASRLQPVPIYDALLLQDKISLRKMPSYQGDQDWRNLPVSTIMSFDVVTVRADETVGGAKARLESEGRKHHAYPVVDAQGDLAGMICHHELREREVDAARNPVKSILQERAVVSLKPETSIRDVAQILVLEDVMQAPVVSATNPKKILGLVTLHDVARQQNAIDQKIGR